MAKNIAPKLHLVTLGEDQNSSLRRRAAAVEKIDAGIKKIIKNMFAVMKLEGGIGLAAPQVGIALRIIVIDIPQNEKERIKFALINPRITAHAEETQILYERCLSVPGKEGLVPRFAWVEAAGLNEKGKEKKIKASGIIAQALQHETDHLDGILFIDKAVQVAAMGTLSIPDIQNAPSCNLLTKNHKCEDGVEL
jgi:peptide deformylase